MEAIKKEDIFAMFEGIGSQGKGFTIADIEALPEEVRAELFDGELIIMESPSVTHQEIVMWLGMEFRLQIRAKGGKCRVLPGIGVYLMNDDKNYVIPDISIICEREKLDNKGCHGALDLAVEIVSPSNRKHDYVRKLAAYIQAGVREYWIVDPEKKVVIVHELEKSEIPAVYRFTDAVKAGIFEDIVIDFSQMEDYDYGENT